MSQIRADNITNRQGTGAPIFVNGIRVTGLTSIANIVAGTGTFSGAVSVGGTLTYEDVTNIDAVGLVTARTGIKVLAGGIDVAAGGINVTGGDLAVNEKITHVGDTNTAIKFGTDSIALDTAGSLRVQLTNDGKVGINTNNPQKDFDVYGTSSAAIRTSIPGKAADFICNATGGLIRTVGAYPLILNTNQTERLRIGTAGQIGIAGANYGTDGQVLTSKGGSAAVQWADAGGVWSQINSQQISSSVSQVDVNFGANAGITTSYAQIKVYYDVWLNSGDKLYLRGAYGFSGTFTNDIKTSDYWYSGFWHRAGETNMQWPLYGENNAKALISADSNTSHHSGEMIITNAAGRLYQTGSVSWPALVYNTQGYTGGTNDAKNFTISGHLKGGDNNPLQGIRIYSGQNIIAGEVRTYGLAAT